MKQILTILATIATLSGQAQTIHTDSASNRTYANCYFMKNGEQIERRLYVMIVGDNLSNDEGRGIATLYYEIRKPDGEISMNGNVYIKGADYTGWDGSNEFPYIFTAGKLNLTIKSDD